MRRVSIKDLMARMSSRQKYIKPKDLFNTSHCEDDKLPTAPCPQNKLDDFRACFNLFSLVLGLAVCVSYSR